MSKEREYFFISINLLPKDRAFPFQVHIFNPQNKNYSIYLNANSPLCEDKRQFLSYITMKGGKIAISLRQKRTFLRFSELEEENIPDLVQNHPPQKEIDRIAQIRGQYQSHENDQSSSADPMADTNFGFTPSVINDQQEKEKTPRDQLTPEEKAAIKAQDILNLKNSLCKGLSNDDFLPLIKTVQEQTTMLSLYIGPSTSLAKYLGDQLLDHDSFTNRLVALSFLLAKQNGLDDDEELGDLIIAAFISHLGTSQINSDIDYFPHNLISYEMTKELRKHSLFSIHLAKKAGLQISPNCASIIEEHHERIDGTGYPHMKKDEFVNPLSQVLGLCAHVLEFSGGKINGERYTLKQTITLIRDLAMIPGLENNFPPALVQVLYGIIVYKPKTEMQKEVA